MYLLKRHRWPVLALICISILIFLSACDSVQTNTPSKDRAATPAPTDIAIGPDVTVSPTIRVHHDGSLPPTLLTPGVSAATRNNATIASPGAVPAGFPSYFSFGIMNAPNAVPMLDDMRQSNGTAFTFRYQYLTGGVNTGHGWEMWNQPAGQFAADYMHENAQHRYTPTFVYYEMCQSNGPHPGSYCGGHEMAQDTANLTSASTMHAYFANWALLLQKIRSYGGPVLVIVEPNLWGFLQSAAHGTDNAAQVPASVNSSGYAAAAAYPNTAQGFAWRRTGVASLSGSSRGDDEVQECIEGSGIGGSCGSACDHSSVSDLRHRRRSNRRHRLAGFWCFDWGNCRRSLVSDRRNPGLHLDSWRRHPRPAELVRPQFLRFKQRQRQRHRCGHWRDYGVRFGPAAGCLAERRGFAVSSSTRPNAG